MFDPHNVYGACNFLRFAPAPNSITEQHFYFLPSLPLLIVKSFEFSNFNPFPVIVCLTKSTNKYILNILLSPPSEFSIHAAECVRENY